MALKTFFKLNAVSHLSDARYAAGMGVDELGIVVDPMQAAYLPPDQYHEIAGWVAGATFVGELPEASPEDLERIDQAYGFERYECPANMDMIQWLADHGKTISVRLPVLDQPDSIVALCEEFKGFAAYFLMPSAKIKDGLALARRYPVVLTVSPVADVLSLLAEEKLKGLSASSIQELAPGQMDSGDLMDLLETLELSD